MSRNVISTNAHIDVSDEYGSAVSEFLSKTQRSALRESTQNDKHGQESFWVRVHEYVPDDGNPARWLVDYRDEASREVEEFDDQDEAEGRYEEQVLAAAENMGTSYDDLQERFTKTDVESTDEVQVPGPLPDLPEVEVEDLAALVDCNAHGPVLCLKRTDDGEGDDVVLDTGPDVHIHHSQIIFTRGRLLDNLDGDDGEGSGPNGRLASKDVPREELAEVLGSFKEDFNQAMLTAADGLF